MGHVILNTGDCDGVEIPVTDTAIKMVRGNFNPSGMDVIDVTKSLAAALISQLETIRDSYNGDVREAEVAITHVQTACMFGLASATSKLFGEF